MLRYTRRFIASTNGIFFRFDLMLCKAPLIVDVIVSRFIVHGKSD
jgi:hypothetical protein